MHSSLFQEHAGLQTRRGSLPGLDDFATSTPLPPSATHHADRIPNFLGMRGISPTSILASSSMRESGDDFFASTRTNQRTSFGDFSDRTGAATISDQHIVGQDAKAIAAAPSRREVVFAKRKGPAPGLPKYSSMVQLQTAVENFQTSPSQPLSVSSGTSGGGGSVSSGTSGGGGSVSSGASGGGGSVSSGTSGVGESSVSSGTSGGGGSVSSGTSGVGGSSVSSGTNGGGGSVSTGASGVGGSSVSSGTSGGGGSGFGGGRNRASDRYEFLVAPVGSEHREGEGGGQNNGGFAKRTDLPKYSSMAAGISANPSLGTMDNLQIGGAVSSRRRGTARGSKGVGISTGQDERSLGSPVAQTSLSQRHNKGRDAELGINVGGEVEGGRGILPGEDRGGGLRLYYRSLH